MSKFIELTDVNGIKFVQNVDKIDAFWNKEGHILILMEEDNRVRVKETYSEIKELLGM